MKEKKILAYLENFSPPIMVQSKKCFTKILLFMHNKQRNNANSKIGVKKILNLVYLSLKKGVRSGSVGQMYRSADPDPHQNVTDPQHCFTFIYSMAQT